MRLFNPPRSGRIVSQGGILTSLASKVVWFGILASDLGEEMLLRHHMLSLPVGGDGVGGENVGCEERETLPFSACCARFSKAHQHQRCCATLICSLAVAFWCVWDSVSVKEREDNCYRIRINCSFGVGWGVIRDSQRDIYIRWVGFWGWRITPEGPSKKQFDAVYPMFSVEGERDGVTFRV